MTSGEAPREQLEAQLLITARIVRRAYDVHLAELDLNLTEASLLRFVQMETSLSQRELADHLHIGRAATGSLIEALERRGLLTRGRDQNDARVWRVTLTSAGAALARSFDEANRELLSRLRSGLDRKEQHHLGELLAKLRSNAESVSPATAPSVTTRPPAPSRGRRRTAS